MTARVVQVSGKRLSEFLRQPRTAPARVEVTSPPSRWAPLKPALVGYMRSCRANGTEPPVFSGVPLCLFGSEWRDFQSAASTSPARGRCTKCQVQKSCGFGAEVPDELLPISTAGFLQRWRDYSATFARITGRETTSAEALAEGIMAAYGGPVSLEPSVLVSKSTIDPSLRFVVFPHRATTEAEYRTILARVENTLSEIGSHESTALIRSLSPLPPAPVPVGLESHRDVWRLKMYLRLERATPAEKQAHLDALRHFAPGMETVALDELQMLGLVVDGSGLHTLKAYVAGQATAGGAASYPPPLAADHPIVRLAGDRALATLDIWRRGTSRANKWDFNLREHYLAGDDAERFVANIASTRTADRLRPLLIGPTYRADIVAVGVRDDTFALYMELN